MDKIKYYLKKIHNQLESSFTHKLRSYGLTCTQFDMLAYLSKEPDHAHTLTDISAHFGVKRTSAIHVLKILEKNEFIYKTIHITGRARQVLAELNESRPLLDAILFAGLSKSDLHSLERMLAQVYANLESETFQNF